MTTATFPLLHLHKNWTQTKKNLMPHSIQCFILRSLNNLCQQQTSNAYSRLFVSLLLLFASFLFLLSLGFHLCFSANTFSVSVLLQNKTAFLKRYKNAYANTHRHKHTHTHARVYTHMHTHTHSHTLKQISIKLILQYLCTNKNE